MDLSFEKLDKFIDSAACIFQYKAMDYPTPLQQHLIVSYFELI
jgi:hypothetical protein